MSNQYKVPQNIDMQDKIVGPLTLYQFLYLLAGLMVFYTTLKSTSLLALIFIGIPALLISGAFAFVKVNDQPFSRFIISLIYFLTNPKTRVWHHGGGSPRITVTANPNQHKSRVARKIFSSDDFARIAQNVDKGGK